MKRFVLPVIAISGLFIMPSVVWPQEAVTPAPTPAANQKLVTSDSELISPGAAKNPPQSKAAKENAQPKSTNTTMGIPSGVNSPGSESTPNRLTNPWDKYAPIPELESSDEDNVGNDARTEAGKAPGSSGAEANPWDKYTETEDDESDDLTDVELPEPTGTNPWDKYVPAKRKTPSAGQPSGKPAPKAEPEKPLELAKPLPVLPLPKGKPVIKNVLPVGKDCYYAIEYDNVLIGYSKYKVESLLSLGGSKTYTISSNTRIKVGMSGVEDLKFSNKTQLKKSNLVPESFFCEQKSTNPNIEVLDVNCIYSDTLIAQQNRHGKTESTNVVDLNGSQPHMLFNNLWGQFDTFAEHYWLIVRAASNGGVLDAYDPILKGLGKIVVYAPVKEIWSGKNGKKTTTLAYTISDLHGSPLAHVRVDAKSFELMEIREIGSGLSFRRSDAGVMAAVDKAKGAALQKGKLIASDVYFSDASKLTSLEADIVVRLRGGELAQHEVPGFKQEFYGELKEGYLKGRVKVKTSLVETAHTAPFPLTEELPEDVKPYLEAQPGIESQAPGIINKGRELTWRSESAFHACRRMTGFIANEIINGVSLPSASQAMESGVGNSEGKACLLAAMARSQGLPARLIGGLIYDKGEFMPHYWVEIWLGSQEGWTPFDPTTNEVGFINASHVALFQSGDIQYMAVTVRRFAPHPARKVPFFTTALNWPIGEKRTYSIWRDGVKLGSEVSYMSDMELVQGKEVYHLDTLTTLKDGEVEQTLSSKAILDGFGLPLRFKTQSTVGEATATTQLQFEKEQVLEELTGKDGKPFLRRIPFSFGTYLADQRFLSQWALMIEQVPLDKPNQPAAEGSTDKDTYSLHVFIPETLRSQELSFTRGDEDETITMPDESEKTVSTLETEKGMIFYLDDTNHVLKISIPSQKLEFFLESTEFSI